MSFNMQILFFFFHLLLTPLLPCYQLIITGFGPPGNCMQPARVKHFHQPAKAVPLKVSASISRYQIIITEIMVDPSPPVALPEYEYIELKNVSGKPVDLKGFKLGDESSAPSFNSSIILPPDSFLICCSNTAALQLKSFGRCVGLSNFPSLANESDLVQLISPEGHIIHAVEYHTSWYRNSIKAAGGWSLEMINTARPCGADGNWAASNAPEGGTPGKANNQTPNEPDRIPPHVLHVYAIDNTKLIAVFDEPLDSNSAAQPKNYLLTPGNNVLKSCQALPPSFQHVELQFQQPLHANTIYQLRVSGLKDCAGNLPDANNTTKAGLHSMAASNDILINEILFDPSPEGADYIELFNRSDKIIDLQTLYCSNRNNNNQLGNTKQLSNTPYLLFPGDYVLLTENPDWVQRQFIIKNRSAIRHAILPSLPNEQGSIVLTDAAGVVIDELQYAADWHFPLLATTEGVSLERIDPLQITQSKYNWISAASTAGGGTPGYINSQFKPPTDSHDLFQLSGNIISPDRDGRDDLLLISYRTHTPGTVGTVRIFDIAGKPVRQLVSNALMSANGQWSWDGLSESKQPLAAGIYIIQVSWFNQTGVTGKWKKAVALVRP